MPFYNQIFFWENWTWQFIKNIFLMYQKFGIFPMWHLLINTIIVRYFLARSFKNKGIWGLGREGKRQEAKGGDGLSRLLQGGTHLPSSKHFKRSQHNWTYPWHTQKARRWERKNVAKGIAWAKVDVFYIHVTICAH